MAYRLRTRTDLNPITLADTGRPRRPRSPHPRLHHDHRVISPTLRSALLRLWKTFGVGTVRLRASESG